MCTIWIKSHLDEIIVFFLTVLVAILISVTVFFIVLTALSAQFSPLFDKYSTALGFAGIFLALIAFIIPLLSELIARNKKLEFPSSKSENNAELIAINEKLSKISADLEEIKRKE